MGLSKVWKPLSVVSGLLLLLTYLLLQSQSPDGAAGTHARGRADAAIARYGADP